MENPYFLCTIHGVQYTPPSYGPPRTVAAQINRIPIVLITIINAVKSALGNIQKLSGRVNRYQIINEKRNVYFVSKTYFLVSAMGCVTTLVMCFKICLLCSLNTGIIVFIKQKQTRCRLSIANSIRPSRTWKTISWFRIE